MQTSVFWIQLIVPLIIGLLALLGTLCVLLGLRERRRVESSTRHPGGLLFAGGMFLLAATALALSWSVQTHRPDDALRADMDGISAALARQSARLEATAVAVEEILASGEVAKVEASVAFLTDRLTQLDKDGRVLSQIVQTLKSVIDEDRDLRRKMVEQLQSKHGQVESSLARLQQLLTVTDSRTSESLATIAQVQGAILRWGIGVSREMRERIGPVATLQMAELDRLLSRTNAVQARYESDVLERQPTTDTQSNER